MIRAFAIVLMSLAVPAAVSAEEKVMSGQGAVLRGLDKVNGQTIDVEIFSGGGRSIFGLEIELADCRYPSRNPTGNAYAYLTVRESGSDEVQFQGWMIATAPALNALDHSRYDVWVLRCITS